MTPTDSPQQSKPQTTVSSRKAALFAFLAFLMVGIAAGRQVSTWPNKLRYPGELDYVEGMRLVEMLHLRQGVPIYAPASAERFDAAIYGPLYYLLGARLIDAGKPAFFPLRVLSLIATLGCAACCALLTFWLARSYLSAALAALFCLAYGIVTLHGTSARSDSVALLLCFAGFLVAYRFRSNRLLLLAVPLMLMGFFYKQQFVAAPLAVFVFLLWEKRYRVALEFAALMTLGGLVLLACFQLGLFRGQAFVHHFVLYNLLPLTWHRWARGALAFGMLLLLPLLVSLEFLRSFPDKLLTCYLGLASIFSLLALAKEGSDSNYFLECVLILVSLFSALFVKRVANPLRAAELVLLLGMSLFAAQWFAPIFPQAEDYVRDRAIQDFLRRNFSPGTVVLGYFAGDLVRAGLATPISDPYQYTQLICKGTVAEGDLLAQLNKRRFGLVVLNFDMHPGKGTQANYYLCLTEPLRHALLANYQLAASLEMPRAEGFRSDDRFYAWVPRPP